MENNKIKNQQKEEFFSEADQYFSTIAMKKLKGNDFFLDIGNYFYDYGEFIEQKGSALIKDFFAEYDLKPFRYRKIHEILEEHLKDYYGIILKDNPLIATNELFLIATGIVYDWANVDERYSLSSYLRYFMTKYSECLI